MKKIIKSIGILFLLSNISGLAFSGMDLDRPAVAWAGLSMAGRAADISTLYPYSHRIEERIQKTLRQKVSEIEPESFFREIRYSGAHDRTAKWISAGTVDIGVANAEVIDRLLSQKGKQALDIRILKKTPTYADYVWAARKALPEAVKQKITTAFLNHSKDSSEEKIRIVIDGIRGETTIAELCRKEAIAQTMYYKWSKDLMEAGKRREKRCRCHRFWWCYNRFCYRPWQRSFKLGCCSRFCYLGACCCDCTIPSVCHFAF